MQHGDAPRDYSQSTLYKIVKAHLAIVEADLRKQAGDEFVSNIMEAKEIDFVPEKQQGVDLLRAMAFREKKHKEDYKIEHSGWCFGLFILLCARILQDEDPQKLYNVVKTYMDCPTDILPKWEETLKSVLIPMEWAQWIKYYTANREAGSLQQANIDKILKELLKKNIVKEHTKEKYNLEKFKKILVGLSENDVVGLTNVLPPDQKFGHIISVFRRGEDFYIHDPNYPDFEPKKMNRPEDLFKEVKACLYDAFTIDVGEDEFDLEIDIIRPDIREKFFGKIKSKEIKLNLENKEHRESFDKLYTIVPHEEFVNQIKELLQNNLMGEYSDSKEPNPLKSFLDKGWDDQKYSLLHISVLNDDLDAIKLILKAGADPNVRDIHGNTILHWALRQNNSKIVDFLMETFPNLLMQSNNAGQTGLDLAAKSGFKDIVKKHIDPFFDKVKERKIELDLTNKEQLYHFSLLNRIVTELDFVNFIKELHQNKLLETKDDSKAESSLVAFLNKGWGDYEYPLLHMAAMNNDVNAVQMLLELRADLYVRSGNGDSILYWAMQEGNKDVMDFLIIKFPDLLREVNDLDQTGFHLAIEKGFIDIVINHLDSQIKLDSGLLNRENDDGQTLLDLAVEKSNWDLCQFLIERGAKFGTGGCSINNKNYAEDCALLHEVAKAQKWDLFASLVKLGADFSQKDKKGESPIDILFESKGPAFSNVAEKLKYIETTMESIPNASDFDSRQRFLNMFSSYSKYKLEPLQAVPIQGKQAITPPEDVSTTDEKAITRSKQSVMQQHHASTESREKASGPLLKPRFFKNGSHAANESSFPNPNSTTQLRSNGGKR